MVEHTDLALISLLADKEGLKWLMQPTFKILKRVVSPSPFLTRHEAHASCQAEDTEPLKMHATLKFDDGKQEQVLHHKLIS